LPEFANIGEGRIQRVLAEIVVLKITAKVVERVFDGNQSGSHLILAFNILGIFSDNQADTLENMQFLRAAAKALKLAFYVTIKLLRCFQRFMVGKNSISMVRR
jgi:hypothetical protein